jgi:hypothetical protein
VVRMPPASSLRSPANNDLLINRSLSFDHLIGGWHNVARPLAVCPIFESRRQGQHQRRRISLRIVPLSQLMGYGARIDRLRSPQKRGSRWDAKPSKHRLGSCRGPCQNAPPASSASLTLERAYPNSVGATKSTVADGALAALVRSGPPDCEFLGHHGQSIQRFAPRSYALWTQTAAGGVLMHRLPSHSVAQCSR